MMRWKGFVLLYLLATCFISFTAMAAENFDDGWADGTPSAGATWTSDPDGTTLYASIQGNAASGNIGKSYSGVMGAVATFNVSSVTGLGAGAGIIKTIGILPSGNYLQAQIWVGVYNGSYYLASRVRERDASTSAVVRVLCRFYNGDLNGVNWSTGQNVTVGFCLAGNVVSFYGSVQSDALQQMVLEGPFSPVVSSGLSVYGFTEGDSAMGFACSNLNVVYSQAEFLTQTGFAPTYEVYIPHITGGAADWKDYLQVDNNSAAAATFTLVLYDSTGAAVYNAPLTVSALTRSKTVTELKALGNTTDAQCGKITYSDPGLNFRLSYENLSGGVAEFRLTNQLNDELGFYFSDFSDDAAAKGVALSNMGPNPGAVTLSAIGDGAVLGTVVVPIGAYQKIVGVYQGWFPTLSFDQIDAIVATATINTVTGIVISGNGDNSKLLFTAGVPLE